MKTKVWVVIIDSADSYEQTTRVELVTSDKKVAEMRLAELREKIKKYATKRGYTFDDGKTSVEAYDEGYAAENHYYAAIHESNLV